MIQLFYSIILDVSATAAAFFGTTVRQVSLFTVRRSDTWRTVVPKKAAMLAIIELTIAFSLNLHNLLKCFFSPKLQFSIPDYAPRLGRIPTNEQPSVCCPTL